MTNQSGRVIGILSAYSVMILAIGLMNHVIVVPPLLQVAKRDAWISVLVVMLPYLAWVGLLHRIMKRTGQEPLLLWLNRHWGRIASGTVRAFFIIYLFLIAVMTLKDTTMWTHTSYLPRTPEPVVSASLVLVSVFAVHFGIRTIAVASGILLPFVIVFGDFVMSANLPQKNYALLTPILEHGWEPALRGTMYVGGGLAELFILLLFQHRLKSDVRPWSLYLLASFLVLLVLGPVTGAISEFGPYEAAELRYPAYEEWRLVKIGKYIRHVDFLSIYQWLSGAFVRIALSMFLLLELLTVSHKKYRAAGSALLGLALVILVELPVSDMQYTAFLKRYYLPGSLWGVTGMLLLLFLLTSLTTRKRR